MCSVYSGRPYGAVLGALALVAGAATLSACSSPFGAGGSASWFPSMPSFSTVQTTPAERSALSAEPLPSMDRDCPTVEVRVGGSTLAIAAKTQQPIANDLRYQLTISELARQCALTGPVIRMRVGVQGRVLVGPAGAPSQIDVPLRYAVVQEGVEPKMITTKFKRFGVTLPPGAPTTTFTDVEEDLSFPVPRPGVLDTYVVYVGFDEQGGRSERPANRKAPPKAKRPPA
jgi:hypothetical protein